MKDRINRILMENFDYIEERELQDLFTQEMREGYEPVEVMGMTYDQIDILKEMDETAFRQGFNDWLDSKDDAFHYNPENGEWYALETFKEAENQVEEDEKSLDEQADVDENNQEKTEKE